MLAAGRMCHLLAPIIFIVYFSLLLFSETTVFAFHSSLSPLKYPETGVAGDRKAVFPRRMQAESVFH